MIKNTRNRKIYILTPLFLLLALAALVPAHPSAPASSLSPQGTIVLHNKVTSVQVSVSNSDFVVPDKIRVDFSARINANSYGLVKYRWSRSDGSHTTLTEINFAAAGTQVVTTSWTMTGAHSGDVVWEAVEIIYPNSLTSNKANYTVPSLEFRVRGVNNLITPDRFNGPCPKEFLLTSQVMVLGKGTVQYRWVRSDGGKTPPQNLVFDGPGTKTVTTTWKCENHNLNEGIHRWITIEILYPNHILPPVANAQVTGPSADAAEFDLACSGFTSNPAVAIRISVSVSNPGIEKGYNCPPRGPNLPVEKMLMGSLTVKNLSSNPIKVDPANPGPPHSMIVVFYPVNAQSRNHTPTWPLNNISGDGNWKASYLRIPDLISPNGQYDVGIGGCYNVFDNKPIFYFGAIMRDLQTGQTAVSNLIKWETTL